MQVWVPGLQLLAPGVIRKQRSDAEKLKKKKEKRLGANEYGPWGMLLAVISNTHTPSGFHQQQELITYDARTRLALLVYRTSPLM